MSWAGRESPYSNSALKSKCSTIRRVRPEQSFRISFRRSRRQSSVNLSTPERLRTHFTRRRRVMRARIGCFLVCAAIAGSLTGVAGQTAKPDALAARLQVLEDREAIRALLVSYARTLDERDFAGFEQLWAKDAEFIGGSSDSAKGPAAIANLL